MINSTDKKYKTILFFLLCFCVLFIFNTLTPMVADDYTYSYNWSNDLKNETLRDVYDSMVTHWLYWHGRVIANGLASAFLMWPKYVFNICNSLIFTLIILFASKISCLFSKDAGFNVRAPLLCLFFIWSFTPSFGQVFLWLDGSCNYSWGVAFVLAFVFPFMAYFANNDYSPSPVLKLLLIIVSFIAGAFYESGAVSAIFIALCILVYCLIKNHKVQPFLALNLIAAIAGFIWMMNAPSMKMGHRGSLSLDAVIALLNRVSALLSGIFSNVKILALAVLAVLIFVFLIIKFRKTPRIIYSIINVSIVAATALAIVFVSKNRINYSESVVGFFQSVVTLPEISIAFISTIFCLIFVQAIKNRLGFASIFIALVLLAAGVGSIAAFIFADYFPTRATVYYVVYLSIASLIMLSQLNCEHFNKAVLYSITLIFVVCFIFGSADIYSISRQNSERTAVISEAVTSGSDEIYLEAFSPKTKYSAPYGLDDLVEDYQNGWMNTQIARYYGLKTVYLK